MSGEHFEGEAERSSGVNFYYHFMQMTVEEEINSVEFLNGQYGRMREKDEKG